MPVANPVSVVVVPVPVTTPGFIVHVPVAGKPDKATLPVAVAQVGWVMVPTAGTAATGCAFTTTFDDAADVQPAASVTVKL